MGDMADMVKRLRTPGKPPQLDGYRLYVEEAKASGETPTPYNEWIKTATPTGPTK